MTIQLHSWYPTANTSGLYTLGERFGAPDTTPRYCTCGTKLRRTNRDQLCSPCDDKRRKWLADHARIWEYDV